MLSIRGFQAAIVVAALPIIFWISFVCFMITTNSGTANDSIWQAITTTALFAGYPIGILAALIAIFALLQLLATKRIFTPAAMRWVNFFAGTCFTLAALTAVSTLGAGIIGFAETLLDWLTIPFILLPSLAGTIMLVLRAVLRDAINNNDELQAVI